METTAGTLLDGRVRYMQPQTGYRTGIEPVLLAASVAAKPGDVVLEAGTGAGAGLLCLVARVPGVVGFGVERDPALAALAEANLAANGFVGQSIVAADLLTLPPGVAVDHAMANPPWHLADSTATADGQRDAAKRGRPGLIAAWAQALARRLRHRGSLTLIVPARAMAESLAALDYAGCGSPQVLPLWPRAGVEARIVLIQGIRGGRGGARMLPGLVLHAGDQGYSAAAQAILRGGGALPFGGDHSSPSG
jgi:tRNA1Val (adenine37-N6)-methyltransferase